MSDVEQAQCLVNVSAGEGVFWKKGVVKMGAKERRVVQEMEKIALGQVEDGEERPKTAERMRALEWLAEFYELSPEGRHKKQVELRKLELDERKQDATERVAEAKLRQQAAASPGESAGVYPHFVRVLPASGEEKKDAVGQNKKARAQGARAGEGPDKARGGAESEGAQGAPGTRGAKP